MTQYGPNKHRRWSHDDFFDLYTWENYDGDLLDFQLCYAKDDAQRALCWSLETGYQHEGIELPSKISTFIIERIHSYTAIR